MVGAVFAAACAEDESRPPVEIEPEPSPGQTGHGILRQVEEWGDRSGRSASAILDLAVAPDGESIVTVSRQGVAAIWSVDSGQIVRAFDVGTHTIRLVAVAATGRVATMDESGSIRTWSRATGKPLQVWSAGDNTTASLRFDQSGGRLATAGERGIGIWDSDAGTLLHRYRPHDERGAWSAEFVGDGSRVVSAGPDDCAVVYDVPARRELDRVRSPPWYAAPIRDLDGFWGPVAVSADGKAFAVGTIKGPIQRMSARGGAAPSSLAGSGEALLDLQYSEDGLRIASLSEAGLISVWDRATGEESSRSVVPLGTAHATAFGPGGAWIASGGKRDGALRRWDAATGAELPPLASRAGSVRDLATNESASVVLVGTDEGADIRDRSTGKLLARIAHDRWDEAREQHIGAVGLSPDGSLAATAGADRTVAVWRTADGSLLNRMPAASVPYCGVSFLDEAGTCLAVATNGVVRVWEFHQAERIREWKLPNVAIRRMTLSPDQTRIALAGDGSAIHVCSVQDGSVENVLGTVGRSVRTLAFSPDGTSLAADGGRRGVIHVWRLDGSGRGRVLETSCEASSVVRWSAHGRWLYSIGSDSRLHCWDVERRAAMDSISIVGGARALAVAGQRVWVGCLDSTICEISHESEVVTK